MNNMMSRNLKGHVLGYGDRGEKLQIAVLDVEGRSVRSVELLGFRSPHEVAAHFVERPRPLGLGVTATLALGTGDNGWRASDYWIDEAPFYERSQYDEFPFYFGPYQMGGAAVLLAIATVTLLRRRWPDLPVNETDPDACYKHVACSPAWPTPEVRAELLGTWLGSALPPDLGDGGWDAMFAAYATWMGLRGDWPIDLHRQNRPAGEHWVGMSSPNGWVEEEWVNPALSFESLIFPAGPVSFYWPPDDRATNSNKSEAIEL